MNTFKAFRIHEAGGKISARFEDLTLDALTPGEVVIDVQYSGINYKDALAATGAGKILRRYPLVGGIDLAGVVRVVRTMRASSPAMRCWSRAAACRKPSTAVTRSSRASKPTA